MSLWFRRKSQKLRTRVVGPVTFSGRKTSHTNPSALVVLRRDCIYSPRLRKSVRVLPTDLKRYYITVLVFGRLRGLPYRFHSYLLLASHLNSCDLSIFHRKSIFPIRNCVGRSPPLLPLTFCSIQMHGSSS